MIDEAKAPYPERPLPSSGKAMGWGSAGGWEQRARLHHH